MNLIVRNLETSVMEIRPHLITMESETVLTQYLITNWTLAYNNASNVDSGIQMTIVLKRRILNAILTVYLPTILVLIIVYATNFFKDFFFEAIVTVNLTSLLVLTTLFISVSSSLPQTVERQSDLLRIEIYILSQAYVKMVDVWLIFAQVVPWIEVLPLLILIIIIIILIIISTSITLIVITSIMIKVLLHTLIDWMRTEEESGREVDYPSVEIFNI